MRSVSWVHRSATSKLDKHCSSHGGSSLFTQALKHKEKLQVVWWTSTTTQELEARLVVRTSLRS